MLTLLATLCTTFLLPASDVQVIAGSRADIAATVASEWGRSYLAVKGAGIEFRLPDGTSGQGIMCILFEPTRGFFHVSATFERSHSSQNPCEFVANGRWRYAVTAERLIGFSWAGGVLVCESTDRAESFAEAESMALRWIEEARRMPSRRLSDTAVRPCERDRVPLSQNDFPPEFFEFPGAVPNALNRFAGPLPVSLKEVTRKKDGFELILKSIPFGRSATLTVWRSNPGQGPRIVSETPQLQVQPKYWTTRSKVTMLPDDPETKR